MDLPNGTTTLVAGKGAKVALTGFTIGDFNLPVSGEVEVPEGTTLVLIPKAAPANARQPEPAR